MEGVLVTGTATAALTGECVRCLEPIRDDVEVDFQELFVYEESDIAADEEDEVPAGSWATCSTSSHCCGMRWCCHCRSSRCARTTVRACAPSVAPGSRTTRATSTRADRPPVGGARRADATTTDSRELRPTDEE